MANLGAVLKEEIARLARKATKKELVALRKDVARLKRDVAALKRQNTQMQRENRRMRVVAEEKRKEMLEPTREELASARINSRFIANLRKRLGLSRQQLAQLIGVGMATVAYWENKGGKIAFHGDTKAKILQVRKLGKREVKRMLGLNNTRKRASKKTAKKAAKGTVKKTAKKTTTDKRKDSERSPEQTTAKQ